MTLPELLPPSARHVQARKNKRNGRDGQRIVARLVHAKDIGTLGGIDLDGGWFLGEVKNVHGLPAWLKRGIAQLAVVAGRKPGFLFVRNVRPGVVSEVYVLQTLTQFLELSGFGDFPQEQPAEGEPS